MAKETTEQKMMTYISKARHYFIGKNYEKAIEFYGKAIKIDKPMAKQLEIINDVDRAKVLLKEQQDLPLRGLGILYIDFLNLSGEFVVKHKMYITERMKNEFRLPVMVRTRFVKAESAEQLEEEIKILQESQKKVMSGDVKKLNDKITALEGQKSESDVIIKDLNEKLLQAGDTIKKLEKADKPEPKIDPDQVIKTNPVLVKENKSNPEKKVESKDIKL